MNDNNDNSKNTSGTSELAALVAMIALVPALIRNVNEILKSDVSFPNIPCKVVRNFGLWDTLAESNGWCLQQNEITKHCRIVDPEDIRRAWGTKVGMYRALESLKNN